MIETNLKISCYCLFVILHLALFSYLSLIVADQNMPFHGHVRRVIGRISIWGLPHVYKVTSCTEIDTAFLKYLASYSRLNSIFDFIMQSLFTYLLLLDWFSFVWDLQTLIFI